VPPNPELGAPFQTESDLRHAYLRAQTIRERLRAEMIALQEEMDWLVYAAYGLLPADHPAVGQVGLGLAPARVGNQRKEAGASPGPTDLLDQARLAAIRDNEHIRRIEQPVYKRRWDEQWKVGNEWRCGEIAYAAEFIGAFEWWLKEKAE